MLRVIQGLVDTSYYKPPFPLFMSQFCFRQSLSDTQTYILEIPSSFSILSELFHSFPRKVSPPHLMMDKVMKAEKCHVLVKL